MNDTTSTADDPDGPGSVVTGDQAGASSNDAAAAPERILPLPSPQADQGTEAAGSDADDGSGDGPARPVEAVAGTSEAVTAPVTTASAQGYGDEATARLRWPPTAGATNGSGSDGRPSPVPPGQGGQPHGAPSRPVNPPSPAPGMVPGPAPSAAAPPPWARMPGPDGAGADTVTVSRPVGGLLDEPPTTFMEPPGPPGPDDIGAKQESHGGWSPVRGVRSRKPRQASLQLKRLDPWSMLKLALVLAVVLFLVWLVAVGVLYGVLNGMGVWDRLNGTYADLVAGDTPTGSPLISAGRVFGLAAVVGAINSLLFAVAMTVGAFVYNVAADLVGGIEVTLSERD